ncbi:hypothetical protein [Streptomyces fructofermentans]|uniref:Uncharacterized protein n=1 Tax=Streptomyces fructofermentans TaxID=152141 RepID=A0A918NSE8_9ACTN|nr:hypothetical protein [Streptomyces fructofermentans]GGX91473.1 hypothetical protein GCM10010515_68230 [Streptomyces fructofermentans]
MRKPPDDKTYRQRMAVWILLFLVGVVLLASSYYLDGASLGADGDDAESNVLAWAGLGVTAVTAVGGLVTSYAELKAARRRTDRSALTQPLDQSGPDPRWGQARTIPRRHLHGPTGHQH